MKISKQDKAEYSKKRRVFLAANKWCAVALALRGEQVPATHVHHRKGRAKHYLDESTFVAVSKDGDKWIHANPDEAEKLGLIERESPNEKGQP